MKFFVSIFISILFFTSINSTNVYLALKNKSITTVNLTIQELEKKDNSSLKNAYLGALFMRKSGITKLMTTKMKLFKKGHSLLEYEIKQHPKNVEYRFLRLIIQENAPTFLKYNQNIANDKKLILDNYPKLGAKLKNNIKEYSSISNIIKSSDLKS